MHLARRQLLAWGLLAGSGLAALRIDHTGGDPLGSMQWPGLREQFLGDGPMRFPER